MFMNLLDVLDKLSNLGKLGLLMGFLLPFGVAWWQRRRRRDLSRKFKTVTKRVEMHFKNEIEFYCLTLKQPIVEINGSYSLTDEQQRKKESPKHNEPHALLEPNTEWLSDPVTLRVETTDYAAIQVLRAEGQKPPTLSANALLFCKKDEMLILHKRSKDAATFPGCLNVIGGNFIPYTDGSAHKDHSLVDNLIRELGEEIHVQITEHDIRNSVRYLASEISTGFIQWLASGVGITQSQVANIRNNLGEGTAEYIAFDELEARLKKDDWASSGKAHVITWLGMGAPGVQNLFHRRPFNGKSGEELFASLMATP